MTRYIGKHRPATGRHHVEHGRQTTAEIIAGMPDYPITAPLSDGAPGGRHEYTPGRLTLRHIEVMTAWQQADFADDTITTNFTRQRLVAQSLGWIFTGLDTDKNGYICGDFYNLLPKVRQPDAAILNQKLAHLALEEVRVVAHSHNGYTRVGYAGDFRAGFMDVASVLGRFTVPDEQRIPHVPEHI